MSTLIRAKDIRSIAIPVARAATTANITLSGLQTLDTISLLAGDVAFVKNQGATQENGPYVVATGAWTRATFFDANAGIKSGFMIGVVEGGTQDNTVWFLTTNDPIVVGTTGLTFSQISTGGGGVPTSRNLTAGAGLTGGGDLTADRTFDVAANADGSIIANANDVQVGVLATDAQHGIRGGGTQHAAATTSVAGFLSSSDKTKLDGLPSSAVPTTRTLTAGDGLTGGGDLSTDRTFNVIANADGSIVANPNDIQVGVISDAQHGSRGGGTLHTVVTTLSPGFSSAADKTKLDGIATGAAALTSTPPVDVDTNPAVTGVGTTAARSDHKHDVATSTPGSIVVGDAAAEGAAVSLARSDHAHSLPAPSAPANVTKAAASAGVSGNVARQDHKHDVTTATPVATASANAEGSASSLARSDHVHRTIVTVQDEGSLAGTRPIINFTGSAVAVADDVGNDRVNVDITAASVGSTAAGSILPDDTASAGSNPEASRVDHRHAIAAATAGTITVGDASAEGASVSFARADHTHALPAPTGPVDVTKAAASAGSSGAVARSDHKHDISTAAPSATGTANAEGSASSLSRSDHVHRTIVAVQEEGSATSSRPTLNFIGAAVTVTDNVGSDRADVTITAASVGATLPTSIDPDDAASAGASAEASRVDHQHAIVAAVAGAILIGDSAAEGVAGSFSRSDHTHSVASPAAPADVTKAAASAGASSAPARADHKHDISIAAPSSTGTANAEGSASSLSRSDHVHRTLIEGQDEGSVVASRPKINFIGAAVAVADNGGSDRLDVTITAAALGATLPTSIDPDDAASAGVSAEASRVDHQHAIVAAVAGSILIGDAAAEGVAGSFARSDHKHSLAAPAAPVDVAKTPALAGVSTAPARSDHQHDTSTSAPVATGTTNNEGVSTALARADHVHRTLVAIQEEGAAVASRPTVNFIGAAITAADDAGNDRVNVTVVATATSFGPPGSILPDDSIAEGVSANAARADHRHGIAAATAGAIAIGDAAAEGASTSFARADHTHSVAAPSAPADVTKAAASAGASVNFARQDHKHDVSTAAPSSTGTANAEGSATSLSRSDHVHRTLVAVQEEGGAVASRPIINFIGGSVTAADDAGNDRVNVTVTASSPTFGVPGSIVPDDTPAEGVSGNSARADHRHGIDAAAPSATGVATVSAEGVATSFARSDHAHQSNTAPANVTKAAAAIGTSGEPARADHKHDVTTAAPGATGVATASAEGSATSLARSDHAHQSNTAPVDVTKAAAVIGTSGEPARADHKHDVSTAAPSDIGTANSEGAATSLARSNHVHNLPFTPVQTALNAASGAVGFNSQTIQNILQLLMTGYLQMTESGAPGTPSTNSARIRLKDNGLSTPNNRTQLAVMDASGNETVIWESTAV